MNERAIAASLGLGKGTVGAYLGRARTAGLTWPVPDALSDDDLELLLFPAAPSLPDGERPVPDWSLVDRELRRPSVTRALLWDEYRAAQAHQHRGEHCRRGDHQDALPRSASLSHQKGRVEKTASKSSTNDIWNSSGAKKRAFQNVLKKTVQFQYYGKPWRPEMR